METSKNKTDETQRMALFYLRPLEHLPICNVTSIPERSKTPLTNAVEQPEQVGTTQPVLGLPKPALSLPLLVLLKLTDKRRIAPAVNEAVDGGLTKLLE